MPWLVNRGMIVVRYCTVKLTEIGLDFPPPVPVTVNGRLPVVALWPTVTVIEALPPAEIDDGEKVTVTTFDRPEADRAIGEVKVPIAVARIVAVPDFPRAMVSELGVEAREKSPMAVAVTVSVTVAVLMVVPEVPVTVMVY